MHTSARSNIRFLARISINESFQLLQTKAGTCRSNLIWIGNVRIISEYIRNRMSSFISKHQSRVITRFCQTVTENSYKLNQRIKIIGYLATDVRALQTIDLPILIHNARYFSVYYQFAINLDVRPLEVARYLRHEFFPFCTDIASIATKVIVGLTILVEISLRGCRFEVRDKVEKGFYSCVIKIELH